MSDDPCPQCGKVESPCPCWDAICTNCAEHENDCVCKWEGWAAEELAMRKEPVDIYGDDD